METDSEGFSLVEVVIFIGIMAMFFVSAMVIVTYSYHSMKFNENKIFASQYAEEALEWIKSKKEFDWISFINNNAGNSYCFNTTPITDWPAPSACAANNFLLGSPARYKRNVELSGIGSPVNTVQINITVQWKEAAGTMTVPLNSSLSAWE